MSSVSLVGITIPKIEGIETAEELVAYAARVSNPSNQMNSETAPKLLRYLIKHKHWSPFEMVHIVMQINTTRDIGRQILRHRSFSFQEFSQRYANPTDLGFEYRAARLQDTKNRQNSIETNDEKLQQIWYDLQNQIQFAAAKAYGWAVDNNIAKEQARAILPEGMTKSTMYMSGSLRSWIHYIQLRTGIETQKEHREVAWQCADVLFKEFPSINGILNET